MKKVSGFLMVAMAMIIGSNDFTEAAGQGKIRVFSETKGAYIYVNGQKKAMTGEGYTNILLPEGEYEIKVEKETGDEDYLLRGVEKVFVGADTSVKIEIKTKKEPTEKKLRADAEKARREKEWREKASRIRKQIVRPTVQDSQFVRIQPGTFMMGSPSDEPGRIDNETRHRVTLSKPFYLQATEVTQAQWKAVMGDSPSKFKGCGGDCPVENVSWDDVQRFIRKLNQMTGQIYRLPTEAEWEYACRAGTTTPFNTGKCLLTDQANYNGEYPLSGCSTGEYRGKTLPVATFPPNAWGLYDMHGNVYEWCQDWYGKNPSGHVTDPEGPSSAADRVLRGGGWCNDARNCRSANRYGSRPGYRCANDGFRLVRLPGQ